jgi:hypothetical protein
MEELEVEELNTKSVDLGDRGGNFPRNAGTDLSIYTRLIPQENDFKHTHTYTHIYMSFTQICVCSFGNGY